MKKLLFLFILIMAGCTYTPVSEDTVVKNSTTELVMSLDSTNLISHYVITDDNFHYYYSEDKLLVQKYTVTDDEISIPAFLFIFAVILFFAFGLLIGLASK